MSIFCISDKKQNKLEVIETKNMSKIHSLDVGRIPYPVDQVTSDVVFVSTRGEESIQPVNIIKGQVYNPIKLPHRPRSSSSHPSKSLTLVGSVESTMTSVIDTKNMKYLFSVGQSLSDNRRDYGGGLSCGHPAWVSKSKFLHLDRITRRLEMYSIKSEKMLSSVNLPTSAHHVEQCEDCFYVMCEGSQTSMIPPSVAKIRVKGDDIIFERHQFLPIPHLFFNSTGGHHLTVDDTLNQLYVGTADARMFILDLQTLQVKHAIDSGKGCGHVTLCPEAGLGITTNHTDISMTVFELKTGKKMGDIAVSSFQIGNNKTQGHTSYWDKSCGSFYTSLPQDGKIIEIDPLNLKVKNELYIPNAYLIQGCIV